MIPFVVAGGGGGGGYPSTLAKGGDGGITGEDGGGAGGSTTHLGGYDGGVTAGTTSAGGAGGCGNTTCGGSGGSYPSPVSGAGPSGWGSGAGGSAFTGAGGGVGGWHSGGGGGGYAGGGGGGYHYDYGTGSQVGTGGGGGSSLVPDGATAVPAGTGPKVELFTVPSAPVMTSVTGGIGQATLTWAAPASTGGRSITSYRVYQGTTPGAAGAAPVATVDGSATGVTIEHLTNSTTYCFTVAAVNAAGEGPASNELSATPATTPPGAPTMRKPVAASGQVILSWTAPTFDGGAAVTGYNVYRGTTLGGEASSPVNAAPIAGTTATISGLANGTTYYFIVRAINEKGPGVASAEASATPGARYLYYRSGPGSIGRAELGGSGTPESSFITGLGADAPYGIAVDGQHVYWTVGMTTYSTTSGWIGRADLDGTDVENHWIATGGSDWIAVDGGHIYWSNSYYGIGCPNGPGWGSIGRADLAGGNVNQCFIQGWNYSTSTGGYNPQGVAVDPSYIYWATNWSRPGADRPAIMRARLDGSDVQRIAEIAVANEQPEGVAVDADHVFWAKACTNHTVGYGDIGRSDLDGSNPTVTSGMPCPIGIAVDGDDLYFSNYSTGKIGRLPADGSSTTPTWLTGVTGDWGVAVGTVATDTTPPAPPAAVHDGTTVGVDADSTTSTYSLSANWAASTSADVADYWYAIGTTPGGQETVVWTNAGTVTSISRSSLPLVVGTRYYVSVKARDAVGNMSTVTTSDGITVSTTPKLEGLYTDADRTSENYVFALGGTVHTFASGLRGNSGYSYKVEIFGPSGGPAYATGCTQLLGTATWAMSYTPTPTDGAGYYTLNFYEWPNGVCSGSPSSSDFKSFFVAKATAYTSAALTTPTSSYSEGATAYVVVNTVTTAGEDWNVTWLAPDIACANTAGTDRPDSAGYAPGDGPAGRLPNTAGSYLAYPPTTGDAWNTLANYETQTACDPLGGDNAGQWRLTLYHDPTHHVTLDAFSVTANSAPATPTSLAQYRSDGTTGIAIGGATNQATVVLKAVVSDPDPGQSVRLEAEIEAIGSDFDGAGTSVGALVASGSTASVTISGLWVGLGYHWRARTVDSAGATTDWVSFGGNAESEPDFSVEQTPPAPPATVFDGPNTGVDEDYASWTADTSSLLYGNWTASTSSDVAGYAYAVGTTPGATNLVGWTSVGTATSFGKVLAPAISVGSVYYITVRATDTAGNTSATTFSDGITVIDHPRVDKVFTDAALTDENYVLAAGETAHALAVGLRGTSTKSYRLVVYASSPVYTGPCVASTGSLTASYTPTAPGLYQWSLQEWATNYCGGTWVGEYTKSFTVASATAYTSSALSTTTGTYAAGSSAYVVVSGLLPTAGEDWNVTWLAPDIACANTAGTDRPDSAGYAPGDGPAGRLPNTAGSYLAYPPTTGDAWNTLANYETQTACDPLGGDNAGQWRLTLYHDPTHHVTLDAFSVTANSAPVVTTTATIARVHRVTTLPLRSTPVSP